MRSTRRLIPILVSAAFVASGLLRAAGAQVTLSGVQPLVADPARAKDALAALAHLPVAECQTVEYQAAVARAARNAGAVAQVAEAVHTGELMPATVSSSSAAAELSAQRSWLEERGRELYAKALEARSAGDLKTAAKSYLVAVKCDQALLGRDDHGLGTLSLGALRKMADKHPERPELRFQVGFYSYLFGDLAGAQAALQAHSTAQADAYLRWRGQLWLRTVNTESARATLAVAPRASSAPAASAGLGNPSGEPGLLSDPESASDGGHGGDASFRRQTIENHLAQIDAEIAEMGKYQKGKIVMVNGRQMLESYNQREVKQKLEELEARKRELEAERDRL